MESWFADAKPIDSLEPEIAFRLWDQFHPAPEHQPEPLDLPEFPRASRLLARTSEVTAHEAELAAYYGRVAALAWQHALKIHQVRQYFWMDLRLDNEEADVHLSFPWYDTVSSMDHFLAAVAGNDQGMVYDDQDQGWAVEAWAFDGTLYIRQSNPDSDDEPGQSVALPRAGLQARIAPLRERTAKLMAYLRKNLDRMSGLAARCNRPGHSISAENCPRRALTQSDGTLAATSVRPARCRGTRGWWIRSLPAGRGARTSAGSRFPGLGASA